MIFFCSFGWLKSFFLISHEILKWLTKLIRSSWWCNIQKLLTKILVWQVTQVYWIVAVYRTKSQKQTKTSTRNTTPVNFVQLTKGFMQFSSSEKKTKNHCIEGSRCHRNKNDSDPFTHSLFSNLSSSVCSFSFPFRLVSW